MNVTFELKSAAHAQLAAKFMAEIFKLENPEEVFHYNAAKAIKEDAKKAKEEPPAPVETAEKVAEAALQKAAKPVESVVKESLTVADLVAVASAKSKIVGAEKVKDTIAKHGVGAIRELDPGKFGELKAELEAL